jgi:hypothetical protein
VVREHPGKALANAVRQRVEVGRPALGFVNALLVPSGSAEVTYASYGRIRPRGSHLGRDWACGRPGLAVLGEVVRNRQTLVSIRQVGLLERPR